MTDCPACPTTCPACPTGAVGGVVLPNPTAGTSLKVTTEDNKKKGLVAFIASPMFIALIAVAAVAIYFFYIKRGGKIPFFGR